MSSPITRSHFWYLFLLLFSVWFTFDFITGQLFYGHGDYAGLYYPFRQWFLDQLMNGDYPLWNPYWGLGEPALVWMTIPLDFYSLIEIITGVNYQWWFFLQCITMLAGGYFVSKKFGNEGSVATLGTLLFFLSPVVTFFYFEFIKTNYFIGHMFAVLFMVRWFETGKIRYVVFMSWALFFGMFGTKLEFWMYGVIFFGIGSIIACITMQPKKPLMIFPVWGALVMSILGHAWQLNLLIRALWNTNRMVTAHGFENFFSLEMYRNVFLSLGDNEFVGLGIICAFLLLGLNGRALLMKGGLFGAAIVTSVIIGVWNSEMLANFARSSILIGALVATFSVYRFGEGKHILRMLYRPLFRRGSD